jgi:DNA-binding NarL/FixJ family response regulator
MSPGRPRAEIFSTVAFFGLSIGIVLLGSQLATLWWWAPRPLDASVGAVGALFLAAGVAVGLRARRASAAAPVSASAEGQGEVSAPMSDPSARSAGMVEPLTPRELEILGSLAAGCSNSEIAERHFVSPNTVKTHLRQIYGKLEVSRRVQAVSRARQMGLVE